MASSSSKPHAAIAAEQIKDISVFSQSFPPKPAFTDDELPSLSGKTVLITGATSGIGFEVAKIAFSHGANVNITGRTKAKLDLAIQEVKKTKRFIGNGNVTGIVLDLADLATVKDSATSFLQTNTRLDVLIHNAGVMKPAKGSKTKLGHDLEMGTNCLGPFLLNHYLEPILLSTAANADANSVRILWVASMIAVGTPQEDIRFDEKSGAPLVLGNAMENYMQSKVGNVFLASEIGKRLQNAGVVSVSLHPGILKTEINRNAPRLQRHIMGALLKPAVYGAYTELFAAFSPEVTINLNGKFIVPWGRFSSVPAGIEKGLRSKDEGGTGLAKRFVGWCDSEVAEYK